MSLNNLKINVVIMKNKIKYKKINITAYNKKKKDQMRNIKRRMKNYKQKFLVISNNKMN